MTMNFKELWTGTKEERRARVDVVHLSHKQTHKSLTAKEEEILHDQGLVTRRWFLRRTAIMGVSAATIFAVPAGYFAWRELTREEDDIDTYQRYRDGLISLSRGEEEVGELLELLSDRARLGRREGLSLVVPYGFNKKHEVLVVVVSRNRNRSEFISSYKFAHAYASDNTLALEMLKVPITPVWAGALLAHELVRIRSYLEPGWDWFEIERKGFELEFRLLNKATGGRFNEIIASIAKGQEGWMLELDKNQIKNINSVFEPSRSQIEAKQRELDCLFAVNFAIAGERASASGQDANALKIDYLKTRFDPESKLPFMAKPLARD